jgi:hypothetical protein
MVEYSRKNVDHSVVPICNVSKSNFLRNLVEDQIIHFLDGRTHGEELLHALYDYVLDEPIPEQMRSLFKPT